MDTNTSQRAIVSVNNEDCEGIYLALTDIVDRYETDAISMSEQDLQHIIMWRNRFRSIHWILNENVPVHFTDLGTRE